VLRSQAMDEIKALHRAFAKCPRGLGARYPRELKERAIAVAHRNRRAGASWAQIAEALGLHMETVRGWCAGAPMKRVEIVKDEGAPGVRIITRSGHCIERLSMRDVLTLLEKL